jgi:hypothetical protein
MSTQRRFSAALLAPAFLAAAVSGQQPLPASPYGNTPPGPPPVAAVRTAPVAPPTAGLQSSGGSTASLLNTPLNFPPPTYPNSPYSGGYGYGGYPYIESPAHGYLSGVADVTTSQGQFLSQVQQARLQQTQADMAKLDFRRAVIEQQRYLKSLEPTPDELRQKEIQAAINRSRNNPPPTEIWSGRALNDLLIAIQRESRGGIVGPALPLDPTVLSHINLTTGATTAGVGMLKDLKRFQWPLPLLDDAFSDLRGRVEGLARQAADQAPSGAVNPKVLRDMRNAINDMIAALKAKVDDYTPTQYVQSMRYLHELSDSNKVLQDPNVSNYFSDKYKATGATVGELIQNMNSRGLTFAPAATGEEPYYTALHTMLVSYDFALRQLAAR